MLLTLTIDFIECLGKLPFNIKGYLDQGYGVYFSPTTIKKIKALSFAKVSSDSNSDTGP